MMVQGSCSNGVGTSCGKFLNAIVYVSLTGIVAVKAGSIGLYSVLRVADAGSFAFVIALSFDIQAWGLKPKVCHSCYEMT